MNGTRCPSEGLDDFGQDLMRISAKSSGDSNELHNIETAFPAFVFGNKALVAIEFLSDLDLRQLFCVSSLDEELEHQLILPRMGGFSHCPRRETTPSADKADP